MKIGDRAKLKVEVRCRVGSLFGFLPAGTIGTITERHDDRMFQFETTVNDQTCITYVCPKEIEPALIP